MFCTKCGTPLPDNAKFCTGCGQKLGESTTQNSDSRVCSHCNHQLTDSNTLTVGNKIVCKFCGCEATAAPMGKSKKLEDLALSFNKNAETSALIERAFIFLEDKKWEEATFYFEKILDVEPKNAQAYLGKLLSELHISKQSELANSDFSFENNTNYEKILRFGDEKLISELKSANERIITQKEEKRVNSVYDFALHAMQNAKSEAEFLEAANHFESIANIKDAQQLAEQCRTNAENCRKDGIYYSAAEKSTNPTGLPTQDIALLKESISLFQSISDWRDSKEQITVCQNKIGELEIRLKNERIEAEKKKQKKKKLFTILAPIVSLLIVFTIVLTTVIIPNQELKNNLATFATAKVGSSIWFGSYEQDNNTMNGSELIEWTVLDKTDDWLFVISKRALDCHAYNDTDESTVTWKNCTLRSWLNNTFIDDAFTKKEQSIIMETPLQPDETTDKIFLLNSEEVVNYFKTSEERICKVTIALSKKDIETGSFEGKATCSWALRNADYSWGYTTTVSCGGIVNSLNPKTTSLSCIRPAMCIRISDSSENEPSFDIQPKTVKSTETTVEKATTESTTIPQKPKAPVSGVPEKCEQFIYIDTNTSNLTLYTLSNNKWEKTMSKIPLTYGRNGTTKNKREGDGCTPLGIFNINFYYGLSETDCGIRYEKIDSDSVWVDDTNSVYYNTLQYRNANYKDWNSAEELYSSYFHNNVFNYCIYFDSNGNGISGGSATSGNGSLITICGKNTTLNTTAGCIDISGNNMTKLLSYLDSSLSPMVVIE